MNSLLAAIAVIVECHVAPPGIPCTDVMRRAWQESHFDPATVSSCNACGVLGVRPRSLGRVVLSAQGTVVAYLDGRPCPDNLPAGTVCRFLSCEELLGAKRGAEAGVEMVRRWIEYAGVGCWEVGYTGRGWAAVEKCIEKGE